MTTVQDGKISDKKTPIVTSLTKEREPSSKSLEEQEADILKEIVETSEAADLHAESEIAKAIEGAKRAQPPIKIPSDLAASGVKSPEEEASKVVKKGTQVNLPISEAQYKVGLGQKASGRVTNKVVFGVDNLLAFALWIGRVIKVAHKHAMRVVFRREIHAS